MNADTEVYQRLTEIENMIGIAARSCQMADGAPKELRTCLDRLCDYSHRAKQAHLLKSGDGEVLECLDELEEVGQRACALCAERHDGAWPMAATLDDLYVEIRDLRRQVDPSHGLRHL